MKLLTFIFFSLFLITGLHAQVPDTSGGFKDTKSESANTQGVSTGTTGNPVQELKPSLSSWEFVLSLLVLIFGMIIISLEVYLVLKEKIDAENTVKFIVVTLIITSTLFLITAGYNNNQIAPAMGLLGTVAGYLLGRQQEKKGKDDGANS